MLRNRHFISMQERFVLCHFQWKLSHTQSKVIARIFFFYIYWTIRFSNFFSINGNFHLILFMTNWNECREIEQKLKKKTKKRTSYRKKAWSVFVFVILLTAIFPFSFFAPSIGNDDNCVVLVFCCCLHSLCRLLIVCNGRYHISMHDDMILVSFSPFFLVQLNEENGIFFTIQKQSTTSIPFFLSVCVWT